MTTNQDYLFMNENIGKKCIITDNVGTLADHIEYNGGALTIKDVSEDGFYILSSGHWCDDNEVQIKELIPMEFISSNGYLFVNEDGTIHPDSDTEDWLGTIQKVDIEELDNYLGLFDLGLCDGGDVLDFGYWDKQGVYHEPSKQWRVDTFHRVAVESDTKEAKEYWTESQIQKTIEESFEWINNNRK